MRDKKRRSAIGLAGAFSLSGTEKAVVKIDKLKYKREEA